MTQPFERQLHDLARILAEIAHTLESTDAVPARVERVLSLANTVVPFRRCALLEIEGNRPVQLYAVPQVDGEERSRVTERLMRVYRLVTHADELGRTTDPAPGLTLPVIGLDSIVGIIRVEGSDAAYELTHLRVLSVIAAQLGAYITTLRLRAVDRRRVDELAAAYDVQQRLAGVVGHDLRNPLHVISHVASMLLEQTSDEKQAQALRRALRSAEHASRLIADLLDVTESRVSGLIRIEPRTIRVVDLVASCVDDLRAAYPQHTIELAVELDPATAATWDADRIQQVVGNLIGNAIAHGAPALPVRVAIRSVGDAISIDVHNFGAPIAPDALPHLFDPFHHGAKPRAHTARGLGLGLYIVAQIVRSHAGTIGVQSTDSLGTSFTIHLPREIRASDGASPVSSVVPTRRPATVMVVDDDPDVRLGTAAVLSKRGYHVVAAADGAEAHKLLRGGLRPSLVLLDLNMPGMDGSTLVTTCQGDPALANIPFVIISADAAAALKLERVRAVLAKPVSTDRLLALVREIDV